MAKIGILDTASEDLYDYFIRDGEVVVLEGTEYTREKEECALINLNGALIYFIDGTFYSEGEPLELCEVLSELPVKYKSIPEKWKDLAIMVDREYDLTKKRLTPDERMSFAWRHSSDHFGYSSLRRNLGHFFTKDDIVYASKVNVKYGKNYYAMTLLVNGRNLKVKCLKDIYSLTPLKKEEFKVGEKNEA